MMYSGFRRASAGVRTQEHAESTVSYWYVYERYRLYVGVAVFRRVSSGATEEDGERKGTNTPLPPHPPIHPPTHPPIHPGIQP